ncbi:hypothetical protein WN943_028416 [Citrus x changshan-huyou]
MGWKAAEKLISHWKVVRVHNVRISISREEKVMMVESLQLKPQIPIHASNVQVVEPVRVHNLNGYFVQHIAGKLFHTDVQNFQLMNLEFQVRDYL